MNTPQIIYIVIVSLSLGVYMTKHGEEKSGQYDFWVEFISKLFIIGLLYWGGFFNQ